MSVINRIFEVNDNVRSGFVNVYRNRYGDLFYGVTYSNRHTSEQANDGGLYRIHVRMKKQKWIIRATTIAGLTTHLAFRWAATHYARKGYVSMSSEPEALYTVDEAHRFADKEQADAWLTRESERLLNNSWIIGLELVEIWEH